MPEESRAKNIKETTATVLIGIIAITIGYGALTFVDRIFGGKEKTEVQQIAEDVKGIKQTLSPYKDKDGLKKIVITGNFSNTSVDNKPTKTSERTLHVQGKIKRGYLYAKVSVNQKVLDRNSDLYLRIQRNVGGKSEEYGGHLITEQSLEVPQSESYSEMLFNLNDIKYKEGYTSSDIEILSGDWLKLLNEDAYKPKLISFVSTIGQGTILEFSIYYECLGDVDCSIRVE